MITRTEFEVADVAVETKDAEETIELSLAELDLAGGGNMIVLW